MFHITEFLSNRSFGHFTDETPVPTHGSRTSELLLSSLASLEATTDTLRNLRSVSAVGVEVEVAMKSVVNEPRQEGAAMVPAITLKDSDAQAKIPAHESIKV